MRKPSGSSDGSPAFRAGATAFATGSVKARHNRCNGAEYPRPRAAPTLPPGEGARGDISACRVLNGKAAAGHRRRRPEEGPGDNAAAVRRAGQIAAEDRAGAGQRGGVVRAVEIG